MKSDKTMEKHYQEEGPEKQEFGRDIIIHNYFFRHGKSIPVPKQEKIPVYEKVETGLPIFNEQGERIYDSVRTKKGGESEGGFFPKEAGFPVMNEEGEIMYDEVNMKLEKVLSPTGAKAATAHGKSIHLESPGAVAKVRGSSAVRAKDTGEAVLRAMPMPKDKKYQTRFHEGLTNFRMSEDFRKRWEPDYKKTGDLNAAIQYILDHNDEHPENTPLADVAGAFALEVESSIHGRPEKMKKGSEVAYINPTHGAMMEEYLRRVLIMEDEQGNKTTGFKNVKEIGGAFVEATGMEMRTVIDKDGNKKVTCFLRGKEYEIDLKENQILADEWRVKERERREKERQERNK